MPFEEITPPWSPSVYRWLSQFGMVNDVLGDYPPPENLRLGGRLLQFSKFVSADTELFENQIQQGLPDFASAVVRNR